MWSRSILKDPSPFYAQVIEFLLIYIDKNWDDLIYLTSNRCSTFGNPKVTPKDVLQLYTLWVSIRRSMDNQFLSETAFFDKN